MSLKHGILGLLKGSPMTGYELDRSFKRSLSNFWQAQTSQIYRELDVMEKKGWLVSERVIQEEKPNKRVYSLTEAGSQELENWLSSPETDIQNALKIRSVFIMRVFFASELPEEEIIAMLQEFRQQCLDKLASFDEIQESIVYYGSAQEMEKRRKYWALSAQYGEYLCKASLDWVEQALLTFDHN